VLSTYQNYLPVLNLFRIKLNNAKEQIIHANSYITALPALEGGIFTSSYTHHQLATSLTMARDADELQRVADHGQSRGTGYLLSQVVQVSVADAVVGVPQEQRGYQQVEEDGCGGHEGHLLSG
jgi:hypothetical protein